MLAIVGAGGMLWYGIVVPAQDALAALKLRTLAVRVEIETDFPDLTTGGTAARAELVSMLEGAGLRPQPRGWPELLVIVHEYRRSSSGHADELVGNVEMTLRDRSGAAPVWSRATSFEHRRCGMPVDVYADITSLAREFLADHHLNSSSQSMTFRRADSPSATVPPT